MYFLYSMFYTFNRSPPYLLLRDLLDPTDRRDFIDFLLLAEFSDLKELSKFVWFLYIFFELLCSLSLRLLFFTDSTFSFDKAFLGILIDFFYRLFDLFLFIWGWYLGYKISCYTVIFLSGWTGIVLIFTWCYFELFFCW